MPKPFAKTGDASGGFLVAVASCIALVVAALIWLGPSTPEVENPKLGATQEYMQSTYSQLVGVDAPLKAKDACKYEPKMLSLRCKVAPSAEAQVRDGLVSQGWSSKGEGDSLSWLHRGEYVASFRCPGERNDGWCELVFHRRLERAA
jgi:hypothetical protein